MSIIINKRLFNEVKKNKNDTIEKIAADLKITRQTLYYKINHGTFNSSELEFFKKRWDLTEIGVYKIFLGGGQ